MKDLILGMLKEISDMNSNEINKEIISLSHTMQLQEQIKGKADFETTLKAHMLTGMQVLNSKERE